jgi:16S rRNA (adenine1518-N6/adenine1519-N6)-dimethyltransferase
MKAKKSLGQNFLKSEIALRKIVEAGEIKEGDIILEIGPGKGALTKKLLEKSDKVIAVEKDDGLFEFLQTKFVEEIKDGKLVLLNKDILELDSARQDLAEYKIIANIPYNITGAILKKFLTEKNQPESMILMVQHEVAKRIIARDGKESILSISVKAYGEPKMIMKVSARYFSPAPKVDSAIIAIKNISRKIFTSPQPSPYKGEGEKINEARFWEIVRTGFAHKRKKLSGNLKSLNYGDHASIKELGNKRAEDLSLMDWIILTKTLAKD